ncbi:hypothetical protein AMR42_17890 [Limnothrix sp. PR1529]|nr:hypothetical protein BCR12_16895 [Limnothrix sp. P13C2]PIB04165.1 hypothetical protein AMR42_17890 [Limnothrix sp. PR1529]
MQNWALWRLSFVALLRVEGESITERPQPWKLWKPCRSPWAKPELGKSSLQVSVKRAEYAESVELAQFAELAKFLSILGIGRIHR